MGFETKYNEFFYHDGHYLDVPIQESKMKQFLENEKNVLETLASEYLKKIR